MKGDDYIDGTLSATVDEFAASLALTTDEWHQALENYSHHLFPIVCGPVEALGEGITTEVHEHVALYGEVHRRFIAVDFGRGPQPVFPRQMRRQGVPA